MSRLAAGANAGRPNSDGEAAHSADAALAESGPCPSQARGTVTGQSGRRRSLTVSGWGCSGGGPAPLSQPGRLAPGQPGPRFERSRPQVGTDLISCLAELGTASGLKP
jgi:hypothetical protein